IKFTWGWPWYLAALVAAVVVGMWPYVVVPQAGFAEYSLFAFAALFYVIGIVEEQVPMVWLGSVFATWSLVDAAIRNDFNRLFVVTLVYTMLGVVMSCVKFFPGIFDTRRGKTLLHCALPFYVTALISAVLSGYDLTNFGIGHLFYGLVPDSLPML